MLGEAWPIFEKHTRKKEEKTNEWNSKREGEKKKRKENYEGFSRPGAGGNFVAPGNKGPLGREEDL
jgi:hypothetical protein